MEFHGNTEQCPAKARRSHGYEDSRLKCKPVSSGRTDRARTRPFCTVGRDLKLQKHKTFPSEVQV